jgi:broad specificity polyphosphatase/5'/3'-nucleotidase SurE
MKHTILITNDDGVEASGLAALVVGLHEAGYPIVVCAPDRERSASTMHLTLHKLLKLRRRDDLVEIYKVGGEGPEMHIFDVSGFPADCIMTALEGGLPKGTPKPALCISGINRGPNMSVDILHSGTIGGARQAGACGLPAIATSIDTFEPEDYSVAIESTLELVRRVCNFIPIVPENLGRLDGTSSKASGSTDEDILRNALIRGDVYLNLNIPVDWNGKYSSTHLGGRWYRDPIKIVEEEESQWMIQLGSSYIDDEPLDHGDSHCVSQGRASVSTLGTWPQSHPLSISDKLLKSTINKNGMPSWVIID